TQYKLSYKTGYGTDENQNEIGWVVGWVEENRHVYFFVTLVKSGSGNIDIPAVRLKITKSILQKMGFFKGER
ncbi:MAG: class D beta-lactamase, partial [Ginsengibacter sp.]